MNMKTNVKERLIAYLQYKGINNSEFGRRIGVSSAFVSAIRKSIQPDKIEAISANFEDLNINWLLTGDGEMLKSNEQIEKAKIPDMAKLVNLVPTYAQAGDLNEYIDGVTSVDCEKIISPRLDVDMAITVMGDSMIPYYPNGSQLFIKKVQEKSFIEWGRVYVLNTCNGAVIKKLYPTEDDSVVKCVSFNPEYPPFKVSMSDIYSIFRVVLSMRAE